MKPGFRKDWEHLKRQGPSIKIAAVCMGFLVVSSLIYSVICLVSGKVGSADVVAVILNALVAAFGFYAIYASIQNDKEVKQFEFFADYNFNFLTNREFINVERMLESCNQEYERIDQSCGGAWDKDQEAQFMKFCDPIFCTHEFRYEDDPGVEYTRKDDKNQISKEYQQIVNYLVYLEAFVPLILNEQLHLEDVDDLFGYRYFIAVNNPVLQEMELFRERSYYRGCFKVYDKWKKHREKDPLGCVIPMAHYDLKKRWDKYREMHPEARE